MAQRLRLSHPRDCSTFLLLELDRLVAANLEGIHAWGRQLMQGSTKAIEDPEWITCMATSADGEIIALGHWRLVIELRQARTGALLTTLAAHRTVVTSVAFSPNGKMLASASDDGTLQFSWIHGAMSCASEQIRQ